MVETVPLEQDEPGLYIDLLDDRVEHHRVRGTVDLRGIPDHRLSGRNQSRSLWSEFELVKIGAEAVARFDRPDPVVGRVIDHTLARAVERAEVSLPPGEDGLAVQRLDSEVAR